MIVEPISSNEYIVDAIDDNKQEEHHPTGCPAGANYSESSDSLFEHNAAGWLQNLAWKIYIDANRLALKEALILLKLESDLTEKCKDFCREAFESRHSYSVT